MNSKKRVHSLSIFFLKKRKTTSSKFDLQRKKKVVSLRLNDVSTMMDKIKKNW
jgi:hypothetical protein